MTSAPSRKPSAGETKQRKCYFCKERKPGDPCSFWAGFCTYYDKQDLVDEVVIDAKYRDLHRYSVSVCDNCSAELRKKHHLFGIIAWGLGFLASVVLGLYVYFSGLAGDQMLYAAGVFVFFALLTGMLFVIECLYIREDSSSPAIILAVLERVKMDPKYKEKGDSFFSPAEYEHMFPDAGDEPLTAEELIARDRSGYE